MHISSNGPKTILAIGGTGTGKSTFGQVVFGVNTVPGEGHDSITKQTAFYENDQFKYIDTPGFSDSDGRDDSEIFRNVLTLIQKHSGNDKFRIDVILWFCLESERCDQTLQRGANLIQKLAEYVELEEFDGNIWKSVLIVIKGPMLSPNLCEGSKVAAKLAMMKFINDRNLVIENTSFKVDHLACWIFDLNSLESDLYKIMSAEHRLSWNVYSKDEIGAKVRQRIAHLPFGFEITFARARCRRCNCLGDPRLFDRFCHPSANPPPKHNVHIERYHPLNLVRDHCGPAVLVHSDRPRNPTGKVLPTMISGAVTGAAALARPAAATGPTGMAIGAAVGGLAGAAAGVLWSSNEKCRDCKRPFTENGCVKQCSHCSRFWGESGCKWKYVCCGWEETRPGCETRPVCRTPECDVKVNPCICGACGMLLGTEGCTKDTEHDIVYENDGEDDGRDDDTESF